MNVVEPIREKKDIVKIENYLKKNSERNFLLFVMGINSGLRISDILSLNVGDVRNHSHINIKEKKTHKYKKFPINSKLKLILEDYVKNKDDNQPLFLTQRKNRLDRIQSYKILNNACLQLGLKYNIGTHSLRKTFGYHHYKQFKDIVILQKIFNHSSSDITLELIKIKLMKAIETLSYKFYNTVTMCCIALNYRTIITQIKYYF